MPLTSVDDNIKSTGGFVARLIGKDVDDLSAANVEEGSWSNVP